MVSAAANPVHPLSTQNLLTRKEMMRKQIEMVDGRHREPKRGWIWRNLSNRSFRCSQNGGWLRAYATGYTFYLMMWWFEVAAAQGSPQFSIWWMPSKFQLRYALGYLPGDISKFSCHFHISQIYSCLHFWTDCSPYRPLQLEVKSRLSGWWSKLFGSISRMNINERAFKDLFFFFPAPNYP